MSNVKFLFQSRISQLSQFLHQDQLLLLSTPNDIAYLTGFVHLVPEERESLLLISPNTNIFFHASFAPYSSPSGINPSKGCDISRIATTIRKLNQEKKSKELLVDKSNLSVSEYETLTQLSFLKIVGFDRQQIWKQRTIKDNLEIAELKKAADITSRAMSVAIKALKTGLTEIQLREIIESEIRSSNSSTPSFPTIVAFGPNSALPHHQPTEAVLAEETPVLIDLGATSSGYNGDMSRTVWFGKHPTPEFLKIEQIVKDAYQATVKYVNNHQGQQILAKDLDRSARDTIRKAGYAKEFIHTTGHGLGLDLHENLSLNWSNTQPILPGMVITIEPGIYLENKFGFRYENMVLVTSTEAEELTHD